MNGIGLILIIKQIQSFLGFNTTDSLSYIFNHFSSVHTLTALVGIFTLLILFNSGRLTKKIPGPLVSVVLGSLFYYLLRFLFPEQHMGMIIGDIGYSVPQLKGLITSLQLGGTIHSPNFSNILIFSSITSLTLHQRSD